ncbi:MAG: LysM domain-containing protein [Firmicutes bacterium]|nr:LysM domain-containing protein [Bacillota bacterium]
MLNNNCTPITHTIVAGDTLWSLAIRYNTTVEKLLELNPGVEVYNLEIGSQLVVSECTHPTHPPVTPVPPIGEVPNRPCHGNNHTEHFRKMFEMQLCWLADQYGMDEVRKIVRSLSHAWEGNRNPCR